MAFTVVVKGVEIKCDTAAEAAELASHVVGAERRHAVAQTVISAMQLAPRTRKAVQFLRLIQEAGTSGIGSAELSAGLGLSGPRGLGVTYAQVSRELESHGRKASDLIKKVRTADGYRLWKPRDKVQLLLALKDLEGNETG